MRTRRRTCCGVLRSASIPRSAPWRASVRPHLSSRQMWMAGRVTRLALRETGRGRSNSLGDCPGAKASAGSARLLDRSRSKLPPRMDGNEPAKDRLDPGLLESGRADHPFEFGHRREATDRFDQVAVAVLVMRDGLADPRHDLVRIIVVGILESGPLDSRELEAE